MKNIKLIVLVAVAGLLVMGMVAAPLNVVLAQTGAAEGCTRITGTALVGSGAVACQYPDGSVDLIHYINGQFVQIAFFSPFLITESGGTAVSVTDAKTGYKTTLSPSAQGSAYRTVEIFDAAGTSLSKFDIKVS